MAIVSTPAGNSTLPVAGAQIVAAPITGWITSIRSFLDEAGNLDEANVDLSGVDGLVGKSTAQTIAGYKTFTKLAITELVSVGYSTTMQLGTLYVTAGEDITAGDLVYVSAWDSTNSRFTVKKAIATTANSTTLYARYFASAAITSAAAGVVQQVGVLISQVTTGLTAGRPVFLSTSGGLWTGTLPAADNRIQVVGWVMTVHATTGRVVVELPGQMIPWSISDQV